MSIELLSVQMWIKKLIKKSIKIHSDIFYFYHNNGFVATGEKLLPNRLPLRIDIKCSNVRQPMSSIETTSTSQSHPARRDTTVRTKNSEKIWRKFFKKFFLRLDEQTNFNREKMTKFSAVLPVTNFPFVTLNVWNCSTYNKNPAI